MRSAGTATDARIRVTEKLIQWSDLILVMEKRHRDILDIRFGALMDSKKLVVLDIADDYHYMEPELVEMLSAAVGPYLQTAS